MRRTAQKKQCITLLLMWRKQLAVPYCILYSMWEWWADIYASLCTVSALLLSLIICFQKMDVICLCSASVTITALKPLCFSALRRQKYSADMPCVCVRMCTWMWMCVKSTNFPFRWALICVQASSGRVSAPYSTDAALEGVWSEGGVNFRQPYMEVLESPPFRDRATHFLFTSRSAHTTGKLTGW